MAREARTVWRWALPLLVVGGCDCGPEEVDWTLNGVGAGARSVQVCILAGECESDAVARCTAGASLRYTDTFAYDGTTLAAEMRSRPPRLPAGRYCFVARARDASCLVIATGATAAEMPRAEVEVELTPVAMPFAECCGLACDGAGNCRADAGPSCVDDDGNECTAPQCVLGECVTMPVTDMIACRDTSPDGCADAACVAGRCEQRAIRAASRTPCADTDGEICTIAQCADGLCVQAAAFADAGVLCAAQPTPCHAATCNGSGACDPSGLVLPDDTDCNEIDGDLCTDSICRAGVCREVNRFIDEGPRVPGGQYRNRCCYDGARILHEVDIFTNENHCGGCGLNCRGRSCTTAGAGAACRCDSRSDCPPDSDGTGWTCGSVRCRCTEDSDCNVGEGQHCNDDAVCIYPD